MVGSGTKFATFQDMCAGTLRRKIIILQKKLAAAKAEIADLRMRLKNAELMYRYEVTTTKAKKAASKSVRNN